MLISLGQQSSMGGMLVVTIYNPCIASLLLLAWMGTAILAGRIAVVHSGLVCVGHGDEELDFVHWRLGYMPDSAWKKANDPRSM